MKEKIGHMPCESCGEKVAVKKNEHETLSYSCDECDGSAYCKVGEGRYKIWKGKITPLAGAAAPAAAPKKDDPAPAKKNAATIV